MIPPSSDSTFVKSDTPAVEEAPDLLPTFVVDGTVSNFKLPGTSSRDYPNFLPPSDVDKDGSLVFGTDTEAYRAAQLNKLSQSARAIHRATGQENWIFCWSDSETILQELKEKSNTERVDLEKIYKSQWGTDLEADLRRSLSGANLDRALNLLLRKDGDIEGQAASAIHADLIDANQLVMGRKRSELETEIRNLLASKSSDQITRMEEDYQSKYSRSMSDDILSNKKISQETKDAVKVYLEGADKRDSEDAIGLALKALDAKNVTQFQEAMRDASPAARELFMKADGEKKIMEAFGQRTEGYDGGKNNTNFIATHASDNALDYARYGKLSAATQISENTGIVHFTSNLKGVEQAIASMTGEERYRYLVGKEVAFSKSADKAGLSADEEACVKYYQSMHDVMAKAGNGTEFLAWEDQIAHGAPTLITALSRHRGTVYDDSVSDITKTVENMSQEDWSRLHDSQYGQQYRNDVMQSLKTFCNDAEVARVMAVVDRKAAALSFDDSRDQHRSLIDALNDDTHWYKANDPRVMIADIGSMSSSEQDRYRRDQEYRSQVDKVVAGKLDGPALDAARQLLQDVAQGRKPELGLLGAIQVEASAWSDTIDEKGRNISKALSSAFEKDPGLLQRLNAPATDADKQFAAQIKGLITKALPGDEFELYIDPILKTGSLPLDKVIAFNFQNVGAPDVLDQLAKAPESERKAFLGDGAKVSLATRGLNEAEKEVVLRVLKDGKVDSCDDLRIKIGSWGGKDEIMASLRQLTPEQIEVAKLDYARKYNRDLQADLIDKLGGARKVEAEDILLRAKQTSAERLMDALQLGSQSHSGFGAAFADVVGNVGTGYQIDSQINNVVQNLAAAARSGSELSSQQMDEMTDDMRAADQNYRDSKQSAAHLAGQAATVAVAVGASVISGGSSLALLGTLVPAGAAIELGTEAAIMGSDYDWTTRQVLSDLGKGAINTGANLIGGELVGAGLGIERASVSAGGEILLSAAAGGAGGAIAAGAAAVIDQESATQVMEASASGMVTGAIMAGAMTAVATGVKYSWRALAGGEGAPAVPVEVTDQSAGDLSARGESGAVEVRPQEEGGIVSGGRSESPAPVAELSTAAAAAPSEGQNLGLFERLNREALAAGYSSRELYAIENLKDPGEILEFARSYKAEYPQAAMSNLRYATNFHRVVPGTEDLWKTALADLQGVEVGAAVGLSVEANAAEVGRVNLEAPTENTSEPALRQAFRDTIARSKAAGEPLNFKIDTRVKLSDASGNQIKLTQADVLYQELQAAYPENHFVFSKPDLNPGDPGYTEIPAPAVQQDGLHISTKENAITLSRDVTLADGSSLPAGSRFAVGTTYDGVNLRSVLPGGKVWAVTPDGTFVQVAGSGQSITLASDVFSSNPRQFGQIVNSRTADGYQNHIVIRTDAKATAPDGTPLLDAYPSGGSGFEAAYKPGSSPDFYAARPKSADHFRLPEEIVVEADTQYGASTASGANSDYFMRSGFADALGATAKNYSGATVDAQSAAELSRIRKLLGLAG